MKTKIVEFHGHQYEIANETAGTAKIGEYTLSDTGKVFKYDSQLVLWLPGCPKIVSSNDPDLLHKVPLLKKRKKQAILSLSGGMDSSSLLLKLLSEDYQVTAIGVDYGQRHKFELEQAKKLVAFLQERGFEVTYNIITLGGLPELLVSGLVDNDSMELKTGHYAHENALTSVVPNRNAILSAIAFAVALSRVKKTNMDCVIALATHLGDFDNNKKAGIYPDCSEEFKVAIEHAFKIGNWDSERVDYIAPYNTVDKTGVLKSGIESCKKLKLDYKDIYSLTNTSYAPIFTNGEWVADFETGSSVERIESFINLGLEDPVRYATKEGQIVSWEIVKEHVLKVCEEWKIKN